MATSNTAALTIADAFNAVRAEHNAAADGNPHLLNIGGKYVAAPTVVADGDQAVWWVNQYGFNIVERQNVLLLTTTTAASGTATGTAYTGIGAFANLDIFVDVSATGGSTATLDVYVDSRLDGTSWFNLAHGATMTTASQQVMHLTKGNPAGQVTITADAGVGTVRAIGWADDIRIRYAIGGATSTFTFRVWFNGRS